MERPHFDIVASGARMKMIRQQRNISVKQVMEYMGFESTQAVYKWEAGKCYPQADNLEEDVASSSCWLWVRMVIWNVTNKGIKNDGGTICRYDIIK